MPDAVFAIPGHLALPTGGYGYARRVLALWPGLGLDIPHLELPGSFPAPTAADLAETGRRLAATPAGTPLLIDGLAYGAFPNDLVRSLDRRIIALVHHPLCLEAGLSAQRQGELKASETAALALADAVVASSPTTARTLIADFAVPEHRITVAEPGTDPARRARGTGEPVALLAVGSLVPRKGYDILLEALRGLRGLDWRLDIAGALDRAPEYAARIADMVGSYGLSEHVRIHGAVGDQDLDALYDRADLFVLASRYEGYGMVLTEAMARGLAIVCTTGGAAAETVPDGAAIKVEPEDARALMWQLGRAIEDRGLRRDLADRAWAAAERLPSWEETARRIAGAIRGERE